MDGPVRGRALRLTTFFGPSRAPKKLGRNRARLTAAILLAPPAIFLAVFYAWPLGRVLASGLAGGASLGTQGCADGATAASCADAWAWIAGDYVRSRVAVALLQAALSVALTLAIALPLAWLHHARRIPWSRWHLALHAAPFVLPVFVVVYGIQLTLGVLPPLLAVVVAHAYYNYGFAARLLHETLDRRPRRLEEAALTLGATGRGAFWRASLPLLLPAMASVALLVFLFSFSSFGVVLFLGGRDVATLETLAYQNLGGAFPRYDRAALLAALQLAINVALFLAYAWLARRRTAAHAEPRPERAPARPMHVALAWGALAAGLAPALAVLVGGFRARGEWTLEGWRALVDAAHPAHAAGFDLGHALALSLGYAAASAALALALALALAYGSRRVGGRWRALATALSALPLGTSSLLLGVGFLLTFGAGSVLDLRGTRVVIVVAHALVAFPFTARVLLPALDALDARLDESAALLGASPLDVARRVHLPLLAPALAVAAGLAAAMSLGDFGASALLMRPDNMGLSVWIAVLDGPFDPARKAAATALAGLLMVVVAAAYLIAERAQPGEVGRF